MWSLHFNIINHKQLSMLRNSKTNFAYFWLFVSIAFIHKYIQEDIRVFCIDSIAVQRQVIDQSVYGVVGVLVITKQTSKHFNITWEECITLKIHMSV